MVDPVEQFLSRLQHPVMAGMDLSLDRVLRFLSLIGSPQRRLPPVIHVAGTNGKGSLIAYLQAIFQASGLRVHRYISPHLVHFRERIVLQGKEIEEAKLHSLLKHIATVLPQQPVTFFEATTALAFLAFADKPADILLLETGCGGRLDATNVVERPLLTAITPISYDHMEFLGNTLTAIAGEKAGIMKRGVPCVIGRQEPEPLAVFDSKAIELQAPIVRLGQEFSVVKERGQYRYRSAKRDIAIHPALSGQFQYDNAATAIACIEQLPQFSISDAHMEQGISQAVWPARLQKLSDHPYARILPPGIELWLDGSHNPLGGKVLSEWLASYQEYETYLVCGMLSRKDAGGFLAPLSKQVKAIYTVTIPEDPQSMTAQQLQSQAAMLGMDAHAAASVQNALQTIAQRAKTPAIICICGSLYLAGKVLAAQTQT